MKQFVRHSQVVVLLRLYVVVLEVLALVYANNVGDKYL